MASYNESAGSSGSSTLKPYQGQAQPRRGSHISEKITRRISANRGSSEDDGSADILLEAMGYQSELTRSRSTWQVAFMSFVLASIPYGLSTTFTYPLTGGGPVNIIWG